MLEIIYVVAALSVQCADSNDYCIDGNNATIWELRLEPDITVSFGDMTHDECETLKGELLEELDSKYIELLKCVEVPVKRENI